MKQKIYLISAILGTVDLTVIPVKDEPNVFRIGDKKLDFDYILPPGVNLHMIPQFQINIYEGVHSFVEIIYGSEMYTGTFTVEKVKKEIICVIE